MPWRLIKFIVIFVIFLLFIMFNIENKSDINFFFNRLVIYDVPVYLTAFLSFIFGMLFAIPFILVIKHPKKDKAPHKKGKEGRTSDKPSGDAHANSGLYGID